MTQQIAISPADHLRSYVIGQVLKYQKAYGEDKAFAVAELAKLRRGLGKGLGVDLEATGLAVAHLYDGKPDEFLVPEEATDAEHAAYAALTLFAWHLQSRRGQSVHQKKYSFGRSARILSTRRGGGEGVRRRFEAVGTASGWEEVLRHASGLIQMFRANDVPLDYGQFAQDLYWLRKPGAEAAVRRRWAGDFYRVATGEDGLKPKSVTVESGE